MNKLYNYLVKDGEAIAVGVSAILFVVFGLGIYLGSSSGGYSLSELTDMEDLSQVNCFNPGLWTMIWMFFIALVLMLLGIVWDIFRNYKSGSKTVYGFLAIILAFVVLYFTSSHDTGGRFDAYWAKDFGISETLSKLISAGLYSLGLLTLLAFLLILVFEVRAFFK
jgi:hypothetical protein